MHNRPSQCVQLALILAGAVVSFFTEWLPVDLAALLIVIALSATRLKVANC